MRPIRTALLATAVLALLAGCTGSADPAPASSAPVARATASAAPTEEPSPKVELRTLTSPELQSRWWTWAASIEEGRNPVTDRDGRFCAEKQKDGIWLLAGTTDGNATRSCTVPADASVAFPVVNLLGTAAQCQTFMDGAKGSAVVDGRDVALEPLGATPIRVSAVPGNPFGLEYGNYWSCGLWVRLDPLAPGRHEIVFRGSSGDFATGVDYWITVPQPAAA